MAPPPSIFIATPAYGCLLTAAYVRSLLVLRSELARRGIGTAVQLMGNESLVQRARNLMTAQFLETQCTHMLWIDADLAFSPESVVAMLEFDKDVTTAIYSKKSIAWDKVYGEERKSEPIQQRGLDYNINIVNSTSLEAGRFCKVLDAATGFMLIKRSVIERMYQAFSCLQCVNDVPGSSVKEYVAIYDCMIDPVTRRYLSEDYAFCRRWQLLGGDIYACLRSPLAHVGSFMFRPVSTLTDVPRPAGTALHVHFSQDLDGAVSSFLSSDLAADGVFVAMDTMMSGLDFVTAAITAAPELEVVLGVHPVPHIDWERVSTGQAPYVTNYECIASDQYVQLPPEQHPRAQPKAFWARSAALRRHESSSLWGGSYAGPVHVDPAHQLTVMGRHAFTGCIGHRATIR